MPADANIIPPEFDAPDPIERLSRCGSVLVFGGTFDPPHTAHVTLPFEGARAVGADVVAYIPAALSPFKQGEATTPAHHRLAMLRLALGDCENAVILTDELDRAAEGQPSYTVHTLANLRRRLPQAIQLRLLIGGDQLRAFDKWRGYERIIELAEPAVMIRPPDTRASLLEALPEGFDKAVWDRRLIETHMMDLSATAIRALAASQSAITSLVPPAVEQYIVEQELYQQQTPPRPS